MSLLFNEILPPSSISDAAFIPNFTEESEQNVVAIAKRNYLFLYQIGTIQQCKPLKYEFNNSIILVCPIRTEFCTNILIVFANLKASILGSNGNSLLNFSLVTSLNNFNPIKIKYALHPKMIAIQLSPHHIDIYSKTDDCLLKYATTISIGCKTVVDFCFIGPINKVSQICVLTEEFSDPPQLKVITINTQNWLYDDPPHPKLSLSKNPFSYIIFPIDPEHSSIVGVLSSSQCLRVTYSNFQLHSTSATICTQDRILNLDLLSRDVYCYVDEAGNYGKVEIQKEGNVHFEALGKVDCPSKIVSLTHNMVFLMSHENTSHVIKLKKNNTTTFLRKFEYLGKLNGLIGHSNYLNAITDKRFLKIQLKETVEVAETADFKGGIRIFETSDHSLVATTLTETHNFTLHFQPNGETVDQRTIYANSFLRCYENELKLKDFSLHELFRLFDASQHHFAYVTDQNELHIYEIGVDDKLSEIQLGQFQPDGEIMSISINDSHLAIQTTSIIACHLPNMKAVRVIDQPKTIAMKLTKDNRLITADSTDYIHIHSLSKVEPTTLYAPGVHTNITEGIGYIIISGTIPVLLVNHLIIPIDCESFYDCAIISPTSFYTLSASKIQKVRLLNSNFAYKEYIHNITSFLKLNDDLYISSINRHEKTYFYSSQQSAPFYSTDNFICLKMANFHVNIVSSNCVAVFDFDLKLVEETKFDQKILNMIVCHSNRYIYQAYSIIDFETKQPIFNAAENQKISYVAMNNKMTVLVVNDDSIALFLVNEDNSYRYGNMINLYESVTCLALNGNLVIVGTKNCKLLVFIHKDQDLQLVETINMITDMPLFADMFDSSFFIGFQSGSILQIQLQNLEPKLARLLRVLQNSMKCIAGLTKNDMYLSDKVLFDYKSLLSFDISNFKKFAILPEYKKHQVLNEQLNLEEAIRTTLEYNYLFLS